MTPWSRSPPHQHRLPQGLLEVLQACSRPLAQASPAVTKLRHLLVKDNEARGLGRLRVFPPKQGTAPYVLAEPWTWESPNPCSHEQDDSSRASDLYCLSPDLPVNQIPGA